VAGPPQQEHQIQPLRTHHLVGEVASVPAAGEANRRTKAHGQSLRWRSPALYRPPAKTRPRLGQPRAQILTSRRLPSALSRQRTGFPQHAVSGQTPPPDRRSGLPCPVLSLRLAGTTVRRPDNTTVTGEAVAAQLHCALRSLSCCWIGGPRLRGPVRTLSPSCLLQRSLGSRFRNWLLCSPINRWWRASGVDADRESVGVGVPCRPERDVVGVRGGWPLATRDGHAVDFAPERAELVHPPQD
jgi:hypothetical protein